MNRTVDAGGLRLDVEVAGPEGGATLLLVSGLGAQRTDWPPELLALLHGAGVRTVTFDNRDVGCSTKLDDAPGGPQDLRRWADGQPFAVPYRLEDMVGDALAVLDHLELARVHLLGASMGGMIAQRLAATHPQRVLSLTSVMSTTGATDVGQPAEEALAALGAPVPHDRAAYIEAGLARARITNSRTHFDEARVRARLAAGYDRSFHPAGRTRQLLAILADGDRTDLLARIDAPTLVVHGDEDTLIDPSGGVATAEAVDQARHVQVPGMGHDWPMPVLPVVVAEIVAHIRAAEGARGG